MSPSEINTLKFFSSEHYGICDIQSNFQHIFRVWGAWPKIPPGAVPVWTPPGDRDRTHSFVPLRNKFLATPLLTHRDRQTEFV